MNADLQPLTEGKAVEPIVTAVKRPPMTSLARKEVSTTRQKTQQSTTMSPQTQKSNTLSFLKIYTPKHRTQSTSISMDTTALKNFINKSTMSEKPIGPGQYNLPELLGKQQIVSKNRPSYSIRSKIDQQKKQIISKEHIQEQLGRDSPGVGNYDYDYEQLSKRVLSNGDGGKQYSFGFGTRFFDFRQTVQLKSKVPVAYNQQLKTPWIKTGGSPSKFGKDSRFKYQSEDRRMAEKSPGPQSTSSKVDYSKIEHYEKVYNCLLSKSRMSSNSPRQPTARLFDSQLSHHIPRDRFDENKKVFFKELCNINILTQSPGFLYDPHNIKTGIDLRNKAFSFSKQNREMTQKEPKRYKLQVPAPGTYENVPITKVKLEAPRGKFSMAPRNIDFISMNNKEGLYAGQRFE